MTEPTPLPQARPGSDPDAAFITFARELDYPLHQDLLVGGNYRAGIVHGGIAWISGQLPRAGTEIRLPGRVGDQRSLEEARAAARICTLRALHVLQRQLGSLAQVVQVLQLNVFVHCTADFTRHSEVADAASDLLQAVFGEVGVHSRTSVGVAQLPKGAAVELSLVAAVDA